MARIVHGRIELLYCKMMVRLAISPYVGVNSCMSHMGKSGLKASYQVCKNKQIGLPSAFRDR